MNKIYFIFGICILLGTSFGYSALSDGIVAYYNMSSGVKDWTNFSNVTAITATNQAGCKIDDCYNFSNTAVTFNYTSLPYQTISFNAWVLFTNYETYGSIFSNYYGTGTNLQYAFRMDNGKLEVIWYDTNWRFCTGTNNLTKNQWNMITLVRSNTSVEIWINGASDKNCTGLPSTLGSSSYAYRMGNYADSGWDVIGLIDEVAIYNRNITHAEVQQLYNSGNGYFPFTSSNTSNVTSPCTYSGSGTWDINNTVCNITSATNVFGNLFNIRNSTVIINASITNYTVRTYSSGSIVTVKS